MTPSEITALAEELEARHRDTWPRQIGHGDLINEDGPEAAAALRALLAEREAMRGALEAIRAKSEHASFVASAIAPSEAGLVALGVLFVEINTLSALTPPAPAPKEKPTSPDQEQGR